MLLCGCAWHREPSAPEPARGPARDTLFRIDQARGDSAAAIGAGSFAPNVAYLRGGAPAVYGREAAAGLLQSTGASDGRTVWEPLGGGVSADLLAGYTFGVAARLAPEGSRPIRFGRYLAYWERTRGQPWRVVAYVEIGGVPVPANVVVTDGARVAPSEEGLGKAMAEARAQLRAADSSFSDLSYRMGMGFAFANTAASDGVTFGSPELRFGPKAIREALDLEADQTSLTWRPVYVHVAGSRDIGYTIGEYVSTGRGPSGAAVQRFGKYLTVWRREKNGAWRFVADGGNASPAPLAAR